tara:strand:- start:206 stop:358 length:153 start_codon:yes stop_codon:yes gene_type:complete
MNNLGMNDNLNFEEENKELLDNEFFSLKFTDSLYKKDIGKFVEFLSSYFI